MFTFSALKNIVKPSPTEEKSAQYESVLYWFRDYWSNRLGLNRNINTEGFKIDVEKDVLPAELTAENVAKGKCDIKWAGGQINGLVEPFQLAHKYEPFSISFPFSKSGVRDESPDPNFKIDTELIKSVIAQPLVQNAGERKLWLSLLTHVIIPSILLLIIEAAILWYAALSNPELARFSITILAISIAAFLYFALAAFVRIGISENTRKVLSAKATIYFYNGSQADKYHYRNPKDIPNWLEAKPYWVFRYLYSWSFELTPSKGFPLIRAVKDVERLDVWLDAKFGNIEWIVSDYHWRELWYKADPNLANVSVWVLRNFHTLKPLTISIAESGTLPDLYMKGSSLSKQWMENLERYKSSHAEYFSKNKNKKLNIGDRLLFSTLNDLWWEKWRYNYGANDIHYKTVDFPATGEQPTSPTFVQVAITRQKPVENTVTPKVIPLKMPSVSLVGPSKGTIYQTTALTVKPIPTMAKTVIPHSSPVATKKHTHTMLYVEIAVVAAGATAAIGYFYMKRKKDKKRFHDA